MYKYLRTIIRAVQNDRQDRAKRAKRTLFLALRKLRNIDHPSPKILFDIFDTLIMPILAYESDIWGQKDSLLTFDKVFPRFVRCTVGIKAKARNIIVAGECGRLPPITQCIMHALYCMNRVMHMSDITLVDIKYIMNWKAFINNDLSLGSLLCIT